MTEVNWFWRASVGGGFHDLLSIIPYFLKFHWLDLGEKIKRLEIFTQFFLDTERGHADRTPKFKFSERSGVMTITYYSEIIPFEDYHFWGRWDLSPNDTIGCLRFGQFLEEFRNTLIVLKPKIDRKKLFSLQMILDLIDKRLCDLPKIDDELIHLKVLQRQHNIELARKAIPNEVYHSATLPDSFLIARFERSQTHYIGIYDTGCQFWGRIVAAMKPASGDINDSDWQSRKEWFAVLHKFDDKGYHFDTDARLVGTTADGENSVIDLAEKTLTEWLTKLNNIRYENVRIRLFDLVVNGHVFGLVETSTEEEDSVTMEPDGLMFTKPWNGHYDS